MTGFTGRWQTSESITRVHKSIAAMHRRKDPASLDYLCNHDGGVDLRGMSSRSVKFVSLIDLAQHSVDLLRGRDGFKMNRLA